MDLSVSGAHDGCPPAIEAVSISTAAMQSPLQALNSMACSVPVPPPSAGEDSQTTNRIDSKSPPLTIAHQDGEATPSTINSSSNINSCQNSSSNSPPSYKDSNNCNNKSNSRPNSRNSNNNDRRAGEENSSDGGNYDSSASFKLTGSQKRPREEEDFPSNGSVDEPMPSRQKLSSASPVHHTNGLTNGNIGTNGEKNEYDDNNSLAAGEESTKENKMVEGCDSLSKNGKICLGDDALLETGDALKDLSPEQIAKRKELVNRLQVQLRTEEMKLVLLKKLKQSQQMVESNSVGVTDTKSALTKLPANTTAIKLPPTPTSIKSDSKPQTNSKSSNGNSSRTTNGTTKTPSVSPSLSPTALQAQRHLLARGTTLTSTMGNSNSSSKPGSPSVSAANLSSSTGLPASLNLPFNLSREVEIIRKDSPSASPRDSPSLNAKGAGSSNSSNASRSTPDEAAGLVGGQTPAQRQAAARLALRKQLEKTLLKITPPKPPPPEMHFIPNPNNQEFLYLVGLEMSVDRLLQGSKVLPPEPQPTPFICSQCGTDFTPAWKWEAQPLLTEGLSPTDVRVVCDACVTNNIKNGLKQEQTNRLKAAFMKALQQEQEIEQRLAAQSTWDTEVRRQQFHQQSRGNKHKHRPELSLEKVSGVEAMTRGNSDLTVTATGGGSGSVSPSVRSPTVSVTAVKERSHHSASPSQGRGSSRHHHELLLQQRKEREHERDRQIRERERQTRERELEREREREREREFRAEKERRDREQREKDSMMFPPGMTKQQKEQFLAMSTAAAMAQAMSNPAALQQMQAAQQQLLRMQGMGSSAASQQIPPHMLAPYLLSHYNPFNMQIQQLMAAQLGAAMQQQGTSGNSNAAAAAALSAAAAAALGAASGGSTSAGGGGSSSSSGGGSSGGSGSSSNSKAAANLARQEQLMRQATEMQRQYLLDMIPNAAGFQAAAVAAAAAAHQGTSSGGSGREGSNGRGDKYKS